MLEKIWGCRNYKNQLEKGCNFFKWVGDEVVDGRNLKTERQRKKILKLKNEGIVRDVVAFNTMITTACVQSKEDVLQKDEDEDA
ncbi:hypothetical protein RYX36_024596 [Vicia faba]